jgi:alpha-L-fucosidase
VKTPAQLIDLYYKSVGRGANLLLNVPPNRLGRLEDVDVASLRGLQDYVQATFTGDLAAGAKVTASNVRGKDPAYEAANLIDGRRDTAWATDDEERVVDAVLEFKRPITFSVIAIREDIRFGQRVDAFAVERWNGGGWEQAAVGTSIGPRRYLRLDNAVLASRVRLRVTRASASPVLTQFSLFTEPAHG